MAPDRAVPRRLHPGAWWIWALGLAAAASRTTNWLLLLLVAGVAAVVVLARREPGPAGRAYTVFLTIGLVVIVVRTLVFALFGAPVPGRVLLRLPEIGLPDWMAGVRLGGPVTAEGLVEAASHGLVLAVLLACFGAANALASPGRLLRTLPAALYEAGVIVTVALAFAPQALLSAARIRSARRLRGRPTAGVRGIRGTVLPVLEGALERSLALAAAMDSRGYGRRPAVARWQQRATGGLTVVGLLAVVGGVFGVLSPAGPGLLGLPLLTLGAALSTGARVISSRRSPRTRYRPDPWQSPEWLTAASGGLAAAAVLVGGQPALNPPLAVLALPALPLLATAGVLLAALPAWLTPPVTSSSSPRPRVQAAPGLELETV